MTDRIITIVKHVFDKVIRIVKVQKNTLPHSKLYNATEVGNSYGITATMVGKYANKHHIKAREWQRNKYGEYRPYTISSGRIVAHWLYSEKGKEIIGQFIS